VSRLGDTVIQILRDAARDQNCIRCGAKDQTTVLAHYTGARRLSYGGGLGRKVHDLVGAHLCYRCHQDMDLLSRSAADKWLHSEEFQHLVILTILRLYEQGTILVKGERRE
jgi:hypothetical protein